MSPRGSFKRDPTARHANVRETRPVRRAEMRRSRGYVPNQGVPRRRHGAEVERTIHVRARGHGGE